MVKNIVAAAALLVFASVYWLVADTIPKSSLSGNVGADGLPKLLAIALAVLCGVLILQSYLLRRRGGRALPQAQSAEGTPDLQFSRAQHMLALKLLAVGIVFTAILPYAGYFASVVFLLIAVAVFYGRKLTPGVILYGLIGACVFYLIFAGLLSVMLPAGLWPDLKLWL